jgi:YidC/Oxa1 family membrane protein insertase
MDFLWPIKWVVEALLVGFHTFWTVLGFNGDDGLTWVLSIIGLVLVIRAALIPLFVRQIKSQRNMVLAQPELQALQKKYKGKTDQESRQKMATEQMEIYKRTGSNPLSSCLPLLIQMPIFSGLFFVLSDAQKLNYSPISYGLVTKELAASFRGAEFFGAPLHESFLSTTATTEVKIMAAVMIVIMTATQFITQRQIIAKNQNPANVQNTQYMQTQKIMLWLFPIIFAISGISFPLGVMWYWLASNFWTMGQQFVVIRNMPTEGSKAWHDRQARLEKRGKLNTSESTAAEEEEVVNRQRTQPVGKRGKKRK